MFERWSAPLTSTQFYLSGIGGQVIENAGGLQGDPVLTLPSISTPYKHLELRINAKFATQQSNGANLFPLTLNNSRCGFPSSNSSNGIYLDGAISEFSFPGELGVMYLDKIPGVIDFSSLFLQYLVDSSFNDNTFTLAGPGSKYVSGAFQVELHGYN